MVWVVEGLVLPHNTGTLRWWPAAEAEVPHSVCVLVLHDGTRVANTESGWSNA